MTLLPSKNWISEVLQEFAFGNPPRRLLRFFRAESGLRFLDNGKINLTPPTAFNDPFELCASVPRRNISVEEMRTCLLKPNGILRIAYQQSRGLSNKDYECWVHASALKQPQHWSKSCLHTAAGFQNAVERVVGIICFMAMEDSDLEAPECVHYWDRYAENHRGLAVEFDPSFGLLQCAAQAKWLFPVNYHALDSRPEWDLGITGDDGSLLRELRLRAAQKAAVWKNEHEWRMIAPFQAEKLKDRISAYVDGERLHHLLALSTPNEKSPITRVFLGPRASANLERSVLSALTQPHLAHVILLRANASATDYSICYS
ncbi:MAG: DUF2971 domain-containing protein [Opitutaceae bacterium]|nr:DUF2971 domain-containing protein [Opitutaceae bacterium]MBP9912897.1 DUF2971 domain-containing protein [Opitutaceae bacterium]